MAIANGIVGIIDILEAVNIIVETRNIFECIIVECRVCLMSQNIAPQTRTCMPECAGHERYSVTHVWTLLVAKTVIHEAEINTSMRLCLAFVILLVSGTRVITPAVLGTLCLGDTVEN